MDGTLYQDLKKDRDNRGRHSICTHCQAVDSFYHRIWQCPAFATCREAFPWLHLVPELPQSLSCHGWPLLPSAWKELQVYFNCLPVVELHVDWKGDPVDQVYDLFVDGTCAWPTEPALRYSAWSITQACQGSASLEHTVLAAGHTVGQLQTAFRAELEAMTLAIEAVALGRVKARIWSDCQSVIDGTQRILQGYPIKPNKSHADLWQRIHRVAPLLGEAQLRVVKVVSHAACSQAVNSVEEWAFWHNRLVDEAAAAYNQQRPDSFWQCWRRVHDSVQANRALYQAVQDVLVRVAHRAKALEPDEAPPPVQEQESAADGEDLDAPLCTRLGIADAGDFRPSLFGNTSAKTLRWCTNGGKNMGSRPCKPGRRCGGSVACNCSLIFTAVQVFADASHRGMAYGMSHRMKPLDSLRVGNTPQCFYEFGLHTVRKIKL